MNPREFNGSKLSVDKASLREELYGTPDDYNDIGCKVPPARLAKRKWNTLFAIESFFNILLLPQQRNQLTHLNVVHL